MPGSMNNLNAMNHIKPLITASISRQVVTKEQQIVKTVLIEKHQLVRVGLQRVVTGFPEVEVVAIFPTIEEMFKLIGRIEVNVVVLGVSLEISECLVLTEYAREKQLNLEFVIIRLRLHPETVQTLVKQGIHGLLDEFASERDLADAIPSVAAGSLFLNRHAREILAISMSQSAICLTGREIEVIALLKRGESNFRIAQALNLKEKTVEAYLTRIYSKLGVNSRIEAIVCLENLYV